ncbi:type I-E CRISPR-associated protein Cse1/CasA [Lysinibacter sp. HNR]|uniref:type I-E CRISPR-associated protein Cse1/CasA n=1 Tax=Lysinibacter sp. HNR TaxID=3031408 RepID=UPI002435811F|nr:type I-E CRISPR-associated protein Cse1/CasA [Lysinibacter sp. HNR]WGD38461.1 type I-E CRISPR-associated protein Cse1/CasA [Lysinibacter sp. HNR]
MSTFNLLSEPWIPAVTGTGIEDISIRRALTDSGVKKILGDTPAQRYALHRLLLAIVQRTLSPEQWGSVWESGTLPQATLDAYLDQWGHRFDLLDEVAPFFQIAGLTSAGRKPTTGVGGIVPGGFFAIQKPTTKITLAEGARWIVHAHAATPSGIRPGTVDDPRVSGGRSYPTAPGWAAFSGGVFLESDTLVKTLLMNVVDDLPGVPAWEDPVAGTEFAPREDPEGLELYTWQSRRILVTGVSQGYITDVLVSNGHPLQASWGGRDPMVTLRTDRDGSRQIISPLWALIPDILGEGGPRTLQALHTRGLPAQTPLRVTGARVALGTMGSVVTDEVDGVFDVALGDLRSPGEGAGAVAVAAHGLRAIYLSFLKELWKITSDTATSAEGVYFSQILDQTVTDTLKTRDRIVFENGFQDILREADDVAASKTDGHDFVRRQKIYMVYTGLLRKAVKRLHWGDDLSEAQYLPVEKPVVDKS